MSHNKQKCNLKLGELQSKKGHTTNSFESLSAAKIRPFVILDVFAFFIYEILN